MRASFATDTTEVPSEIVYEVSELPKPFPTLQEHGFLC